MDYMENSLLLIDGSSFIFRAFHALPNLTAPNGQATGAIYGITNMLKQMQKRFTTKRWICVFDTAGGNFRNEIYPEYKANRAKMPEELASQLQDIYSIIEDLGIPVIMKSGFEADDIIGTLAINAKVAGFNVVIATGDKDFAQLVDENITLINTMSNEILDIQGVIDKFGVLPSQIIDYLALVGDKVDNIPGVDKCGPKTAVKWLNEYKTLDQLIQNQHNIGGVVGNNLRQSTTWLPTAKKLVTIKTDLDLSNFIDKSIHQIKCTQPAIENLISHYSRLGFKTWLKQLQEQYGTTNSYASINHDTSLLNEINDNENNNSGNNDTLKIITDSNTPQTSNATDKAKQLLTIPPRIFNICNLDDLQRNCDLILKNPQPIGLILIPDSSTKLGHIKCALITQYSINKDQLNIFTIDNSQALAMDTKLSNLADSNSDTLLATGSDLFDELDRQNQQDNEAKPTTCHLNDLMQEPKLLEIFAHKEIITINCKEIFHIATQLKFTINNIVGDIALGYYLLNSYKSRGINAVLQDILGITCLEIPSSFDKNNKHTQALIDDSNLINNCTNIAQYILVAEELIKSRLSEQEIFLYKQIEIPLARTLTKMEETGVKLNIGLFKQLEQDISLKLHTLEQNIYQESRQEFNIGSPKQLQEVLFNQMKLPTDGLKKNTSGFSTDENTLNILQQKGFIIAQYLLEYRMLSKLLNTYVSKLPSYIDNNSRIHTTFDQTMVISGRLSSKDPNLQNIPVKNDWGRKIRQCFVASEGCVLICADYSQIELRILTHFCQDENLLYAFNQNLDIHSITASQIFGVEVTQVDREQRRYAKIINFSLLYGKTVFGLANELNIDRATAKAYIDTYFAKYPKVLSFLNQLKHDAHDSGYVTTAFGRKIYLPNINSHNKIIREAEERVSLNAPMQGTSADIIKIAMNNINQWLIDNQLKSKMILQIHDELILEVPTEEEELVKNNLAILMTSNINLQVKLKVDIKSALNWDEAH
jgi:DNA polymerase I